MCRLFFVLRLLSWMHRFPRPSVLWWVVGGGWGPQERRERAMARRRTKKCVAFLYFTFKVVGVATCAYTSGLNVTFVYMRPDLKREYYLTLVWFDFF